MKTVAIAALKGGVGKSTLATNIARWAWGANLRTLLIDCDPQGSSQGWNTTGAAAGLKGPTTVTLDAQSSDLIDAVQDLGVGRDLVVIDTPPALEESTRGAIVAGDLVILPVTPSGADVWALSKTVKLVSEAKKFKRDLDAVIVLNRVQSRRAVSSEVRGALQDMPFDVLSEELGDRVAYVEALMGGSGGKDLTDKKATAEVEQLTRAILSRLGVKHG